MIFYYPRSFTFLSGSPGVAGLAHHRGQIRPVADEVADIARRLQRAKHSLQDISEITGLERGWAGRSPTDSALIVDHEGGAHGQVKRTRMNVDESTQIHLKRMW